MLEGHCPDRRSQGKSESGPERIVNGMRAAIRGLKTSRLSRKDIAEFAGVTPPLVTYYFPDRDALLEAATLPVVKSFVDEMTRCLTRSAPPERVLWDAIELILEFRARDGAVIDAYAKYRESCLLSKSNPLNVIDDGLKNFFDRWLICRRNGSLYALLSQVSLMALCEALSRKTPGSEKYYCHLIYQSIICIVGDAMLVDQKKMPVEGDAEVVEMSMAGV